MLSRLQVVVVESFDTVSEGVGVFQMRSGPEEIKLHHALNPLEHVVVLEVLQVVQNGLLAGPGMIVLEVQVVPDVRVLQ